MCEIRSDPSSKCEHNYQQNNEISCSRDIFKSKAPLLIKEPSFKLSFAPKGVAIYARNCENHKLVRRFFVNTPFAQKHFESR